MAQKTHKSFPEVTEFIEEVKNIVKWFKQNVAGNDELRKKTERKLIQCVTTSTRDLVVLRTAIFSSMASLLDPRFKNLHFQDEALLGTWIRKLKSNEIREQGESLDSENGQLSPAPSSSRDKQNLQNCDKYYPFI
ncbi:hypothetical protein NPIL_441161 [Nephila pilipes]|uniref:Uncharacterized protein n=1 Tax=Nephila pilipes TaxID=299642 RepID=A0A8X6P5L5_NEPPI|nr:hypothetical protein NPIL_441161 [Nephila pilipes]